MSTTRALLPRPAASYAPHIVAVAVVLGKLLLSCTSHSCHWGISTRAADGIERRESRRRRRRRTTTTSYDRVGGVAPASLRWATMAAYIWIILKQPKASSRTKWYTRILWPVHRLRHASGRYACLFLACYFVIKVLEYFSGRSSTLLLLASRLLTSVMSPLFLFISVSFFSLCLTHTLSFSLCILFCLSLLVHLIVKCM